MQKKHYNGIIYEIYGKDYTPRKDYSPTLKAIGWLALVYIAFMALLFMAWLTHVGVAIASAHYQGLTLK